MNVIFTEVDGVLNNALTLRQEGLTSFDDGCFDLYVRMVKHIGAKIVLSSSWRLVPSKLAFFQERLTQAGLIGQFIGVTPDLGIDHRHQEIQHWLKANPGVQKYAILDTFFAAQIPGQSNSFFQVRPQIGLETETLIRMFGWFQVPLTGW